MVEDDSLDEEFKGETAASQSVSKLDGENGLEDEISHRKKVKGLKTTKIGAKITAT